MLNRFLSFVGACGLLLAVTAMMPITPVYAASNCGDSGSGCDSSCNDNGCDDTAGCACNMDANPVGCKCS